MQQNADKNKANEKTKEGRGRQWTILELMSVLAILGLFSTWVLAHFFY